ncbi:MAG TPA: hypothetical protein VF475_15495 [Sphingobium sp.]
MDMSLGADGMEVESTGRPNPALSAFTVDDDMTAPCLNWAPRSIRQAILAINNAQLWHDFVRQIQLLSLSME